MTLREALDKLRAENAEVARKKAPDKQIERTYFEKQQAVTGEHSWSGSWARGERGERSR